MSSFCRASAIHRKRPSMAPKLPTVIPPVGRSVFQVIAVSLHVAGVASRIAGPFVVSLVTLRLRLAAVMDSPGFSVGAVNRR